MFDWFQIQRLKKAKNLPDAFVAYLKTYDQLPVKGDLWESLRMVVFDTETTGLKIETDRILSIGAVAVEGGQIVIGDSYEVLVSQGEPQTHEAIPVHGIIPSDVRQRGISEAEAVDSFLSYAKADVLVAHHVNFDVGIVNRALRRQIHPKAFLFNHIIDTAAVARKLEHPHRPHAYIDHTQYSLDALCDRYHISMEDRHTAWGDALITAKLLLQLLHQARSEGKISLRWLMS
ncbi:MAG: 3'-5' exonuclease [Bacteroidota bacterium]